MESEDKNRESVPREGLVVASSLRPTPEGMNYNLRFLRSSGMNKYSCYANHIILLVASFNASTDASALVFLSQTFGALRSNGGKDGMVPFVI